MIQITDQPIDILAVMEAAGSDEAGALNLFVGTVRDKTASKQVVRLEYEAYDRMAIREMERIIEEARQEWPITGVAAVHRKGTLEIGEAAVVVAVSTPHRQASFEACRFIIDTLKSRVPIWKKEVFADGEVWVAAHA